MRPVSTLVSVSTHSIETLTCTGLIIDHGAQVLQWAPRGHDAVLFMGQAGVQAVDTVLRGGIPVCFPWFGPGREPGAPFDHGFARTTTWRRIDQSGDEDRRIAYRLTRDEATDGYWPYAYEAVLTAHLGRDLTVSLQVTNEDEQAFSYEVALHAFLSVGDIAQVRLEGLDDVRYVDKADGGAVKRQQGQMIIREETDRVYQTSGPVTVVDAATGRTITVSTSGATRITVWNPWREKAAEFPDLAPGEWERFVCVEAGCVLDGAVQLEPGRTHTLSTTISV